MGMEILKNLNFAKEMLEIKDLFFSNYKSNFRKISLICYITVYKSQAKRSKQKRCLFLSTLNSVNVKYS